MSVDERVLTDKNIWKPDKENFQKWLANRTEILEPGLVAEPTIKVLVFLALHDSEKECTYDEIREAFKNKNVIIGKVPENTLRTSVLSLGKTLEKFNHPLELKSSRGRFKLIKRNSTRKTSLPSLKNQDRVVLLLDQTIQAEDLAFSLIEKAELALPGLYFLEWSARWWETYSSKEAEIRVDYEAGAWEKLGIRERINVKDSDDIICLVGLAPGEGLAEIGILKKILRDNEERKIHYLAIDSSQRLLRDHIGLLKEMFTPEIETGKLVCAGVVADIFTNLRDAIDKSKQEFFNRQLTKSIDEFLPPNKSMIVTYFGNCLGNNHQDQETEFFSLVYSIFQNRPLEILVGVSVMRPSPDSYIRNWDDFLLQSPRHLLETKKLLKSSRPVDSSEMPEFMLEDGISKSDRCPPVIPEKYIVRHQIEGQIYRFYYKLAFDLELANCPQHSIRPLPHGSLILLHSIIKYDMKTLVNGIEKSGLFKVIYKNTYHQVVDTPNGKREYAVFSAYLEN